MFVPALILIASTGLLFFFFQAVCQKILQRRFTQEYFQSIVIANRLEFPSVRTSIRDLGASVEYSRLIMMLKCDFVVLTYLLKNASNVCQRFTCEERLLILNFRVLIFCLATRHLLRLCENSAVLNLASILQFFANVVGERFNTVRFGNLAASGLLT
jgi:hypothetical protein